MRETVRIRIEHRLPLSERERTYAILYMGYSAEQLENIYKEQNNEKGSD